MTKIKFNMVGGGFRHHPQSSSALNTNKYVEWSLDDTANISFHIDDGIFKTPDKNKKNFIWLSEGTDITPHFSSYVLNNLNFFKENFIYCFTHDRRIISKDESFFKFVIPCSKSWIQNKKIYKKNKLISFIASNKIMCSGHIYRHSVLKKYEDKVDHYGRGFLDKELPWTTEFENTTESGKIIALKDYMFSFAISNADYDDVFCEKITDCFSTGTIPIFWGSKNIINYFDKDGIIFLDNNFDISTLNEDLYFKKMDSIKNNLELSINFDTAEDFIYKKYFLESI